MMWAVHSTNYKLSAMNQNWRLLLNQNSKLQGLSPSEPSLAQANGNIDAEDNCVPPSN